MIWTGCRQRGRKREVRDFTVWRDDHESFANFINENYPGVDITPGQVKAAFLLRSEWSNTPERLAEREAAREANEADKIARKERAERRKAERAKYANETEEEKAARKEREKTQKAAERAAKRAAELMAKAKELREAAGLVEEADASDPEAAFTEIAGEQPAEDTVTEVEFSEAKPKRRGRRNS